MRPLGHLVARLRRDDRGASLVELAMIAPILLVTVAGSIDCARLLSTKLRMQQAAERAVEMASAGGIRTSASSSVQTLMQTEASAAAPSSSQVSVSTWLECNGTKQADFDGDCNSGDQVARFASVSIAGSYTPSFPWLFGRTATNSAIAVSGSASVRVQ